MITDFTNLLLLINIILYIKCFSNKSKTLNVFIFYLIFIGAIQLISNILFFKKIDNLFLSHFYFIGQYLFLSILYLRILKSNLYKTVIKILIYSITSIILIQYTISDNLFHKFNLFEVILCSLPLILYSVFFFSETLGGKDKRFLYINSGILIYLISSTLLFSA